MKISTFLVGFCFVASIATVSGVDPKVVRPGLKKTDRLNDESLALLTKLRSDKALDFFTEGLLLGAQGKYTEAAEQFQEAYLYESSVGYKVLEAQVWEKSNDPRKLQFAKSCWAEVIESDEASSKERNLALDGLSQILKSSIKADDRRVFAATKLGVTATGTEIGKLFGESFQLDPKAQYAFTAAEGYSRTGDFTRAAGMYREFLGVAQPSEAQRIAVAKKWLAANGFAETAKYPHLKEVDTHYTETGEISTQYKEEFDPKVDVWRMVKSATQVFVGTEKYYNKDRTGDRGIFYHSTVHPLGVGSIDYDELLYQCVSYYMTQAGWSATDQDRVATSAKLNWPADKRTQFPLVDQIKTMGVQYLQTASARSPYVVTVEPNHVMIGTSPRATPQVFDTTDNSTMFSGPGWAVYVMSPDGKIFAGTHKVSKFHHSSFLAGSKVAGAGEIFARDGEILEITNKSGHYRPNVTQLIQTLEELRSRSVNLSKIKVKVGGVTTSGVKLKPWDEDAQLFVQRFRTQPAEFLKLWKAKGFTNDPMIP